MRLPGRALGYAQQLHRQGLVKGTIRAAVDDLKRFGVGGPVRHLLDLVGVESYMRVRHPVTNATFAVRASPFWKYWKGLEAGSEDFENMRFLTPLVKPGQTILDVGAWEGPYTLLFAALVGDTGRVYAFEPDSRAAAVLRDNVLAGGWENVRVEEVCLSDAEGTAPFYDARGATLGTLLPNDWVAGLRQRVVRTTTIDRYCEDHGVAVDGIKVDVEGAEGMVVAGARRVIATRRPWVFLEFHGLYMSAVEKERCWSRATEDAHEVTFVRGEDGRYEPGDQVKSLPDSAYFHVLIRY